MGGRKMVADQETVERAEFVGRTVKELCELLRAGAPYPEISERIERSREALQSIRTPLAARTGARPRAGTPARRLRED